MEPETVEQNLKRMDELGGTTCYNHYPIGWAMAGDTPFKWYKQYTHYGGTKDPLIVHWPKGIRDKGKIRYTIPSLYRYCTDNSRSHRS